MLFGLSDISANMCSNDAAFIRLMSILAVLVAGLTSGYLAHNKFNLSEHLAKKIMTIVLIVFNWPIALLVIWRMQLEIELIWLPIIGVALMLIMTAISAVIFSFGKFDRKSRLTLILAGGLSNLAYTGGAFVCYALFGENGLAMANIYTLFWLPVVCLIFFPLLKINELRVNNGIPKLSLTDILDARFIAIPAVLIAIVLNLTGVKPLAFVEKFHIIDAFIYIASILTFFAIGLRIKFSRLKSYVNLYFLIATVKFVLTPVIALLMLWLLVLTGQNLTDTTQKVIMVLSATPCAVIMVTMSNVFDLDASLGSALWVAMMVVFAAVVVPIMFVIFA